MLKAYHKLVSDCIPEIIEADGNTCTCETLSQEEYLFLLDEKLNEELAEYQESKSLEELADLLEVIRAVVHARSWTLEQLERHRTNNDAFFYHYDIPAILAKEEIYFCLQCTWGLQIHFHVQISPATLTELGGQPIRHTILAGGLKVNRK